MLLGTGGRFGFARASGVAVLSSPGAATGVENGSHLVAPRGHDGDPAGGIGRVHRKKPWL